MCLLLFRFLIHSITFLLSVVVVVIVSVILVFVVNFPISIRYFCRCIFYSCRVQFFYISYTCNTQQHIVYHIQTHTLIDHYNLIKLAVDFNFHTLHIATQNSVILLLIAHDWKVLYYDKNNLEWQYTDSHWIWNVKLAEETSNDILWHKYLNILAQIDL